MKDRSVRSDMRLRSRLLEKSRLNRLFFRSFESFPEVFHEIAEDPGAFPIACWNFDYKLKPNLKYPIGDISHSKSCIF